MKIDAKLEELGIRLPEAAAPVASYMPLVQHNGLAYISGQLPFEGGGLITGRLGLDLEVEAGIAAARSCGLMIFAQLRKAGLLNRVDRVLKLGAFVNSTTEFIDQPQVANGASDLMFEVFGESGRHARAAVGVPALPLGAAVEVDAIVAIKG